MNLTESRNHCRWPQGLSPSRWPASGEPVLLVHGGRAGLTRRLQTVFTFGIARAPYLATGSPRYRGRSSTLLVAAMWAQPTCWNVDKLGDHLLAVL